MSAKSENGKQASHEKTILQKESEADDSREINRSHLKKFLVHHDKI